MANLDIIRGRSTVLNLVNNSGATRSPGDIVVQDTTVSDAFTTSTSSNTTVPVWVVDETIGISSNGRVVVSGYARNVRTLAASAKGDYLYHSTTQVTAATLAGTNPQAGAFGRVTTSGSGTASAAYIFPTVESATASSISIGSNSTDVGPNTGLGGATTYAPSTHLHRGVSSISHTSNTFYGGVTLVAQGAVGITSPSSGTFAINAVAGSGSGSSGVGADLLPWTITIDPRMGSFANTNWDSVTQITGEEYALASSGAQNDEVSWKVAMSAGTWSVFLLFHRFTSRGIATVYFDASSVGTIDMYGADASFIRGSITGISLAATAQVTVKLKMATKNGSSSGYGAWLDMVGLVRSA